MLTPPLTEEAVRALKVGDVVLIDGEMYTGRDAVHAHLMKQDPPVDLHGAVLYHCGPVMMKEGEHWVVKAAGPTTSIREEPYQAHVIGQIWRARGDRQGRHGAEDAGGAEGVWRGVSERHRRGGAVLCADVSRKCWGCIWWSSGFRKRCGICGRTTFAAIVTMDAHGNSLHADVEKETADRLEELQTV